jgi:hypothetical protein
MSIVTKTLKFRKVIVIFAFYNDEDNSVTVTGTIRLCWTFFISLLILFIDLIFQIESVTTAANRWSDRRVSFVPLRAAIEVNKRKDNRFIRTTVFHLIILIGCCGESISLWWLMCN